MPPLNLSLAEARELGISIPAEAPSSERTGKSKVSPLLAHSMSNWPTNTPQGQLHLLLTQDPKLGKYDWHWEMARVVPGRKYSVDIGLVLNANAKLAIEVDGFAHHGKFLGDFKRDRAKDRELLKEGWMVLRIAAGEIIKTPGIVLDDISVLVDILESRSRLVGDTAP